MSPAIRCGTRASSRCILVPLLATVTAIGCRDATSPAAGPAVVFDWQLGDGNREIYRIGIDGRDSIRLTDNGADDQAPSSGGGIVVFTSYRDGNGELYAVPATGGVARRITTTPSNETQPAISRDGTRIAYISDVSGVPKLWTSGADGSNPRRLTANFGFAGSVEASPSWSPAGDRIVFVSTSGGSADLYTVVPGSEPVPLVTAPAADIEPSWGNGDDIAFASDRTGDVEIFIVNAGTGQVRQLTDRPGIDAQPGWISDGKLVYTAWIDGVQQLRWLDPAAPEQARDINLGAPAWPAQHGGGVY